MTNLEEYSNIMELCKGVSVLCDFCHIRRNSFLCEGDINYCRKEMEKTFKWLLIEYIEPINWEQVIVDTSIFVSSNGMD